MSFVQDQSLRTWHYSFILTPFCNDVANNSFPMNWQQHRLTSKEWWLASLDLQRSCNLPKMTVSQDLWCPMFVVGPSKVTMHFQERLCYGRGWKLPPSYIQMFETFHSFRQVVFLYVSNCFYDSFIQKFDWPLKLSQKTPDSLDTSESSESKEQSLRSRSQLVEIPPVLEGQVATFHFGSEICK